MYSKDVGATFVTKATQANEKPPLEEGETFFRSPLQVRLSSIFHFTSIFHFIGGCEIPTNELEGKEEEEKTTTKTIEVFLHVYGI